MTNPIATCTAANSKGKATGTIGSADPPRHEIRQDIDPFSSLTQIPPSSQNEQRRIAKDQVWPENRYYYYYPVADLAWQAAALMPDQQNLTARVLAAAGSWLRV